MIMQNRDKENNVVNGQIVTIHSIQNNTIILKLQNDNTVASYPLAISRNGHSITLYPVCPAYANTICKAQVQTLDKVSVGFDMDNIPCGTAYIALSRVKNLTNVYFLTRLKSVYFSAATFN